MTIDEQYSKINEKLEEVKWIAKLATGGEHLITPSEESLNHLLKVTNELQTVIKSTIQRFRKTGVFRAGA